MSPSTDETRRDAAAGVGLLFWAWLAHGLLILGGKVEALIGVRLGGVGDPFALVSLGALATLALRILAATRLPGRGLSRVLAVAAAAHVAMSAVDAFTPNYDASPLFGVARSTLLAVWLVADLAALALLLLSLRRAG